jgi:hypothetical protein
MSLSESIRNWLLQPVLAKLTELENKMADVSLVLNEVAEGLRGPLATSIQELLAENAALRGEDAAESEAAANVRAAFDEVAAVFAPDDLPDVDPLPQN